MDASDDSGAQPWHCRPSDRRSLLFDVFAEPVEDISEADDKLELPSSTKVFDLASEEHVQYAPRAPKPSLELAPSDDVKTADLLDKDACKSLTLAPDHAIESETGYPPPGHAIESEIGRSDLPELKQFQDDYTTPGDARPLWADISDGDVEHDPLSDGSADEATAESRSQEHPKTRAPITSAAQAHVEFREFAKAILPDVYPASDAESADDEALDEEALLDAVDLPTPCIAAADTPHAGANGVEDADDEEIVWHLFDDEDPSAQCGPLPHVISLADALGLPKVAGDDDSKLRFPTLTGLQSSLEQLVDVSIGANRASLSTRMQFLEKYAAATQQFEFELEHTISVHTEIDASPDSTCVSQLGSSQQRNPPQFGPSSIQAALDWTHAQPTTLKSDLGGNESGPMLQAPDDPHARHSNGSFSKELDASADSTRVQSATESQCGPLPQFGSSSIQATLDETRAQPTAQTPAKVKGKGRRRGKGKSFSSKSKHGDLPELEKQL